MSASSKANQTPKGSEPSARKRLLYFAAFGGVVIAIVVGAAALMLGDLFGRWNSGTLREPKGLAQGVQVAPFLSLNDTRLFPYGIAPSGEAGAFYLSLFGGSAVRQVSADGTMRFFAQLQAPGALAFSGGALYVIDYNEVGALTSGSLKRIAADGTLSNVSESPVARGLPLFAGLVADRSGHLYLTHPENGSVWRITEDGTATLFWGAPQVANTRPSTTALAYDRLSNALIVADSANGTLYRLTIGETAESEMIYRQQGFDPRALAVDASGRVLVAAWQGDNGFLYRLEADGKLVALADGFRQPTSILYREGTAYVVSSGTFGLIGGVEVAPPFRVDAVTLPE